VLHGSCVERVVREGVGAKYRHPDI